ncbi:MAG: pyridoxamine kinase [Ruminococcaceae bacterium]|nr:pyridoxamine kinase [Oscillospiraceae bacterium]
MKRVVCIEDFASLGHCSLMAAIPVLSVMGVQCCPVPTAVLSSQTDGYEGYSFLDMTPQLPGFLNHWRQMDEHFDGVLTGFLGSEEQLGIVEGYVRELKAAGTRVIVDPVMGDNGTIYDTYTPALCDGMRRLALFADVITPNLTEAAKLLDKPYENVPTTLDGCREWVRRLGELGPSQVVLTGVPLDGKLWVVLGERGETACFSRPLLGLDGPAKGAYPGTGDVFASVLAGSLMKGESLQASAQRAADFVSLCIERTAELALPRREGLAIEACLGALA